MQIESKILSSNLLKALFVIAIFLLFFIGGVTYKQMKSLDTAQEWIVHSHKVHLELEQLMSALKDAETGHRGFLITKDSVFLDTYTDAREKVNASLAVLNSLLNDNPGAMINLKTLNFLVEERFSFLATNLESFTRTFTIDEKLQRKLLEGKLVMDKIRAHIDMMVLDESRLLTKREKTYSKNLTVAPITVLMVIGFSVLVFALSFYKMNKDNTFLKGTNYELGLRKQTFDHAEENALIGTYAWNMKTGELRYSDNLFRLFDCQPQEFVPTFDKYLSFIHPDDKAQVIKDGDETFKTKKLVAHEYRVVTKNNKIKYMRSTGSFTGKESAVLLVGTVQDISKDNELQKALAEKNTELINTNKELNSFNYIASHDLQEPLRKIQVFMKRILEKDHNTLSENSKEYFDRTIAAAERMQKLIEALLNYSRANNSELQFAPASLYALLEEVKSTLQVVIEEKNVTINAGILPELNIVAVQFQQLFSNLIGNAIKYSRSNVAPVINITSSIVDKEQISTTEKLLYNKYHKISFADNGIGFEQQYADKIFDLFQRLHTKTEYEGTGIGLAICKKIIKNHNGIITAEGKPNKGSTFNIYIPV